MVPGSSGRSPASARCVLKRLLRVAELLDDNAARIRTLDLADLIWRHIERRRIDSAGRTRTVG